MTTPPEVARLRELIDRSQDGDKTAIEELRPFMDAAPQFFRQWGDLAATAERSLVAVAAGKDELVKEATERKLKELRAELAGEHPAPLETLLVGRIVACWLALAYAETDYHQHIGKLTWEQEEYYQRTINHASKRYLASVKALAVVRRLQLPAMQVNVAEKQVNVGHLALVPDAPA